MSRVGAFMSISAIALILQSIACEAEEPKTVADFPDILPRDINLPVDTLSTGSYRALRIGDSKLEVVRSLRAMRVRQLHPQPMHRVMVTEPEDIEQLATANIIVLVPGYVRIHLQGDAVTDYFVSPSLVDEWMPVVSAARTRQDALDIFRLLLARKVRSGQVMAIGDDRAIPVRDTSPTPEEQALLNKYDRWDVTLKAAEGYDFLSLLFAHQQLQKIVVQHSDNELGLPSIPP